MANELFEIKSGKEGYGYLIEKDAGFISLDDPHNKDATRVLNNIGKEGNVTITDRFKIFAVFQKFGVKNANGRIYPEKILKKQVEVYKDKINDRRSYGESNHPESVTLDLDRLAFGITDLWWEGRTLVGEAELILSPGFVKYGVISCVGDKIANYIRLGWKIGVSSRGLGSVKKDSYSDDYIVQDDFEITCWDIVCEPSTNSAYIGTSRDETKPWIESKENKKEELIEKLDKFLENKTIL